MYATSAIQLPKLANLYWQLWKYDKDERFCLCYPKTSLLSEAGLGDLAAIIPMRSSEGIQKSCKEQSPHIPDKLQEAQKAIIDSTVRKPSIFGLPPRSSSFLESLGKSDTPSRLWDSNSALRSGLLEGLGKSDTPSNLWDSSSVLRSGLLEGLGKSRKSAESLASSGLLSDSTDETQRNLKRAFEQSEYLRRLESWGLLQKEIEASSKPSAIISGKVLEINRITGSLQPI